jgi:hypothetical protein
MSKVKIQGNASGTGVLTVTAPNTSTDRTITLPDGTGTLIADDGNNNLVLSGAVSSVGANANASVVNRTGSDGDVISIKKDGSEKGNIGTNGSNIYLNSEGGTIKLQVSGTDTYNGDSTAWYPATDNAKDLGYASFRYKDLYLSGGLKVGGTGAANTLDDYEEGTFTATLTSSTPPTNPPTATGNYTKVGDWVHFSIFRFANVDTSGASGEMKITGLPFTVGTNSITTNFATHHFNFDTSKYQWGEIYSTQISFLESQNGGAWQNWSITAGTGKYLSISGSYRV